LTKSPKDSKSARGGDNFLLSKASIWEIFIKLGTGKLELPTPPESFLRDQLRENGIKLLPIRFAHTAMLPYLPKLHKDPFDRLIIAQALTEKLPVLAADSVLGSYGLENLF
jgi:PIN domain nuclease of toxin-antitoxin system